MPNPSDYKTEDEFVSACIATRQDEHPEEDTEQSAAICYSEWRNKSNKTGIIHKTHAAEVVDMEFVLSDETVDRYGDVILSDGWVLDDFNKNPIALFNHNPDFPIGKWHPPRVANRGLRSKLKLAPEGTSPRIDEIRKLIDAGILRAVSVGFHPITHEPLSSKNGAAPGNKYVKSALVECSVVSVPANPNALAVAKALKISDETKALVFGKHADNKTNVLNYRAHGKHAENQPIPQRNRTMTTPIAQRIIDAEQRIVKLKDQLNEHLSSVNDEEPTEADTVTTETITKKIAEHESARDALKKAEKAMMQQAQEHADQQAENGEPDNSKLVVRNARPFAAPAQKLKPEDYLWRGLSAQIKHYGQRGKKTLEQVVQEEYGDDKVTRQMLGMVTKSAVVPASTTGSGWADTLVQTVVGGFVNSLTPYSVYPALRAKGTSLTFGPNAGAINLPYRASTPNVGGGFVLQGAPIPVVQAAFAPVQIVPHKISVITTMTREITQYSTPSIESIMRTAILEDTAAAIDTALLDATAGSATRPHGLRYDNIASAAIAETTHSSTASIVGFIGDIGALIGALISGTNGNMRSPVFIMNPGDVLKAQLLQGADGVMPFRDELGRGTLAGVPVLQTTTGTSDYMYIVDAADFVTATGDTPRFDVSDQATLHMDTAPAALGTVGTPNTVAAPVRSLFQTDSLAIRMTMDLSWIMRRQYCSYWITAMAWN